MTSLEFFGRAASVAVRAGRSVVGRARAPVRTLRDRLYDAVELPRRLQAARVEFDRRVKSGDLPRIILVKQDVQSDLYCCPMNASAAEIVCSTLMRTGPVALFTRFAAEFCVVRTEPDLECSVWQQPCTECRWTPLDDIEALRDRVPGRNHGQSTYAVSVEQMEWQRYDIVISVDVAVPARITRRYPSVAWCYYIREPKTSAYNQSKRAPLAGQDLFLNQYFRRQRDARRLASHEVEFPYYLQYYGCFHDLFGLSVSDGIRRGVFLEHHTPEFIDRREIEKLTDFGPVATTAAPSSTSRTGYAAGMVKSTASSEQIIRSLLGSKYFVKLGGTRQLWGNAVIEAISAGCLALGDAETVTHGFLFSRATQVTTFSEILDRLSALERDSQLYEREVYRQRQLVDYLCFLRPMQDLQERVQIITTTRATKLSS